MMTSFLVKCRKCLCDLILNSFIDEKNCFMLCENCKNCSKLYSKTFCLRNLLLSKNDLISLKYLHNKKKTKYYLDDDIENIIKIKFDEIQKNKEKRNKRIKKQESIEFIRRKTLGNRLAEYKLEIKPFGDCFTYIKYGYPSIDVVIQNEISKSIELTRRKKILYKKLQQFNLPYNETYDSCCYKFVNGISDRSLNETINDVKIEQFFMDYTNYLELLKSNPDDIAKDKALENYINNTEESNRHEIANDLINKTFTICID